MCTHEVTTVRGHCVASRRASGPGPANSHTQHLILAHKTGRLIVNTLNDKEAMTQHDLEQVPKSMEDRTSKSITFRIAVQCMHDTATPGLAPAACVFDLAPRLSSSASSMLRRLAYGCISGALSQERSCCQRTVLDWPSWRRGLHARGPRCTAAADD